MPRFSSQRTRQALLNLGVSLDPDLLPENLELFDQDGNPLDVNKPPVPPGGTTGQILTKSSDTDFDVAWIDPPVPPPSGMVWKGTWDPTSDYVTNDVVQYDDGNGMSTYLFIEDVAHTPPGDPPMPNFDGDPITQYWNPANTSMTVTLDATSPTSDVVYNQNSPYAAVAFKTMSGGTIQLLTEPQDGVFRDLIGNFYKRNNAGTGWTFVQQDNDSAGLGHPRISTNQASNWFLLVLSTTDGGDPTSQYGTSIITLGTGNTASYGTFHLGAPTFPVDSVIQIA